MGIRFYCPNGHKLNVKEFQGGQKGICPYCGVKIDIPTESTRKSSKQEKAQRVAAVASQPGGETAGAAPMPGSFNPSPEMPQTATYSPDGGYGHQVQQPIASPTPTPQPSTNPIVSAPAGPAGISSAGQDYQQPAPTTPVQQPIVSQPSPISAAQPAQPAPTVQQPAMPDPLAEAGNAVWYVRPSAGGQFGPASADIMRSWLDEGRVSGDSMVWCEGWPDWRGAKDVFPQLGAGHAAPPDQSPKASPIPEPAGISTAARSVPRRKRGSRTTQAAIITALLLAVMSLLGVFMWVLYS